MYEDSDDSSMKGTLRDWRKALRTPATYRVGNTVRIQPQFIYLVLIIGGLLLLLCYYSWWTNSLVVSHNWTTPLRPYNATYPLTEPFVSGDLVTYRIGIISDLDTNSKSDKAYTFISYFKKGFLSYNKEKEYVSVTWDTQPPTVLSSTYSHKGRGMELSELIVYDGRLLTFDDRSGMVFEILNNKVIPWLIIPDGNGHVEKGFTTEWATIKDEILYLGLVFEILNNKAIPWLIIPDGNGHVEKGFKTEWATIKDEILYLGSIGKEWTTASGSFESYDPMWVKAVNKHGEVQHLSWVNQYKAVRSSIGINWPGYMIHESGAWSQYKRRWHFLPRRCSYEPYNETRDEIMGCNYLVTTDDEFENVKAAEITKKNPKLGYSSFKFIPGTNDEAIVALKTTEFEGKTSTFISAFTTEGKVLLKDTHVQDLKYEGFEFI